MRRSQTCIPSGGPTACNGQKMSFHRSSYDRLMAQGLRVAEERNKPQHAANRRFQQAGFRDLECEKIQTNIISHFDCNA